MKKLDIQKIITVDSNDAIKKYQGELIKYIHQNILLTAQIEKMQSIIEEAFEKSPDTFPDDYIIENKENK